MYLSQDFKSGKRSSLIGLRIYHLFVRFVLVFRWFVFIGIRTSFVFIPFVCGLFLYNSVRQMSYVLSLYSNVENDTLRGQTKIRYW